MLPCVQCSRALEKVPDEEPQTRKIKYCFCARLVSPPLSKKRDSGVSGKMQIHFKRL